MGCGGGVGFSPVLIIMWDNWCRGKGSGRVDRDQPYLFPPSLRDWLAEDHPVWLVIRVVEDHLDTSAFHGLRRTGGAGGGRADPRMPLQGRRGRDARPGTPPRPLHRRAPTRPPLSPLPPPHPPPPPPL